MSLALSVRLLSKHDCHLCDVALRMLERVALDVPLDVQQVDIAALGEAEKRYQERVPVIEVEGQEVQSGKISEWRLRGWLKERGYIDATRG